MSKTAVRPLTSEKSDQRRVLARAADASLRLEGLQATPRAQAIAEGWISGELSDEEMLAATIALHRH